MGQSASYKRELHTGYSYHSSIGLQSTGMGQSRHQNIGRYEHLTVSLHTPIPTYNVSYTPQVPPIYSPIKSLDSINPKETTDITTSMKDDLDKEIESDDFLREFFSVPQKIEHLPTSNEIKEQYYSRFKYDLH